MNIVEERIRVAELTSQCSVDYWGGKGGFGPDAWAAVQAAHALKNEASAVGA